jgi:hypothetical protein
MAFAAEAGGTCHMAGLRLPGVRAQSRLSGQTFSNVNEPSCCAFSGEVNMVQESLKYIYPKLDKNG